LEAVGRVSLSKRSADNVTRQAAVKSYRYINKTLSRLDGQRVFTRTHHCRIPMGTLRFAASYCVQKPNAY
ncbi:MAG: hypothetical protein PSN04_02995, partial [Methyloprofundus sp.]|nr:hypothetical protein [Methyloprofundus sp.]